MVTPKIQPSNKFDVQTEKQVFKNDPKLEQLFERIATNKLKEADWENNRQKYLSRIHENIQTRSEFKTLHSNISSNSTNEYL